MGCISFVRYTVSVESVQSRRTMSGRFYHWRGSSSKRGIKATATDIGRRRAQRLLSRQVFRYTLTAHNV